MAPRTVGKSRNHSAAICGPGKRHARGGRLPYILGVEPPQLVMQHLRVPDRKLRNPDQCRAPRPRPGRRPALREALFHRKTRPPGRKIAAPCRPRLLRRATCACGSYHNSHLVPRRWQEMVAAIVAAQPRSGFWSSAHRAMVNATRSRKTRGFLPVNAAILSSL